MISTEELKRTLTDSFAESVAKDIVHLMMKSTSENLEVDFRISEGRMIGGLDTPNTWFKIDCPPDTSVYKSKEIISEVFGEDFDVDNVQDCIRMNERIDICENFTEMVRIILNSGLFSEDVSNVLRSVALGNVPVEIVPIKDVRFLSVEIGDASEDDYLLTVQKTASANSVTGQWTQPTQPVNSDLFQTHRETGMDFNEIVKLRQTEGDPRYNSVVGVQKKRYSFEVHCNIAADYSFCEPPKHVVAKTGA